MNDAVLDFRFGKYGFNGSEKPDQIIRAGDENVLNSAVFQTVEYRCPVFGALDVYKRQGSDCASSLAIVLSIVT